MAKRKIIGAVEIGTSKVVVLVGEIVGDRSLNIIGRGQVSSYGLKKGDIVNFRNVSGRTQDAILVAEKNAGTTIEAVYLAQTGGHLKGFFNKGSVTVSSPDNRVDKSDMQRAVENAKRKQLPPGRVYIHHIRNGYRLDGRPVENPASMRGEHLEVGYWHIHSDEKKLTDHIHVINGMGLKVEDVIVSSIASGCIVTNEAEKKNGVLVIDIGCGTTDYVLYRKSYIVRTGVIPVGGDHITNDLSMGLRIGCRHSEKLKLRFAKAMLDPKDKNDQVWLIGDMSIGDRRIPRLAIYKIVQARLKEIFQIVRDELGASLDSRNIAGGVVLTGGTSRLPRIANLAGRVLGMSARQGKPQSWVREGIRVPEYTTVLGLLYYGLTAQQSSEKTSPRRHLIRKMAKIFNF